MDGSRFDQITRSLFVAVSRRGSVGVLVASVGGIALGRQGAAAQREVQLTAPVGAEDTDPTCKHEPAINNKRCRANLCTKDRDCFCTKTVNGRKRCVKYKNRTIDCPRRNQCNRNKDCRNGEVCVLVGGCCRHPSRHLCLPLCG